MATAARRLVAIVRSACCLAFDERLPRLEALADSSEPAVALKALDMLARFGGLNFTESAARVAASVTATVGVVRQTQMLLPDNGRSREAREAALRGLEKEGMLTPKALEMLRGGPPAPRDPASPPWPANANSNVTDGNG
jgi:hypothetical protein